jgi:methionyl-tRNA formyltransferase
VLASPPSRPTRLAYLGTPVASVGPLRALHDAGFDIALVVTRADKRRGRGSELSPSPVKSEALALGLPVSHKVDDVLDCGADLGVVVAFGLLIQRPVLERLAFVNLHFSLLPRWRGAAPVERAILAGDRETGVCLMALEEELDTGPVYACIETPIEPDETADVLRSRLVAIGSGLLVAELRRGLESPAPQVGEPTYAAKITPDELELQWDRPAAELARVVRIGGAWTTFRHRRVKVLKARVEGSELVPLVVQPEGRAVMAFDDYWRGVRAGPGERLGS